MWSSLSRRKTPHFKQTLKGEHLWRLLSWLVVSACAVAGTQLWVGALRVSSALRCNSLGPQCNYLTTLNLSVFIGRGRIVMLHFTGLF